jgi:hypothetical protein
MNLIFIFSNQIVVSNGPNSANDKDSNATFSLQGNILMSFLFFIQFYNSKVQKNN